MKDIIGRLEKWATGLAHMFGFVGSNEILTSKLEWLDPLSTHCGVGPWDAVLHEGNAMHPKARWTWSEESHRLCGYTAEKEFPTVVQSWWDRLHPDDASATLPRPTRLA